MKKCVVYVMQSKLSQKTKHHQKPEKQTFHFFSPLIYQSLRTIQESHLEIQIRDQDLNFVSVVVN